MRSEWQYEKKANCGKVIDTAKVIYYGGVTLCFTDKEQRRFTSPDAAMAQLSLEGYSKVKDNNG